MVKTVICDLFGIDYPIIQGGMAWVSTAPLVAAVSNAGGLGILGCGGMDPEILAAQIRKCDLFSLQSVESEIGSQKTLARTRR